MISQYLNPVGIVSVLWIWVAVFTTIAAVTALCRLLPSIMGWVYRRRYQQHKPIDPARAYLDQAFDRLVADPTAGLGDLQLIPPHSHVIDLTVNAKRDVSWGGSDAA